MHKDIPSWVNRAARWGAGFTNVFGRPKALGPEKPACIAAQHTMCGRAVMEGLLKVEKRAGVWKERYCVLDENGRFFVYGNQKERAKPSPEPLNVLDLPLGSAEFDVEEDGILEIVMRNGGPGCVQLKCEQTTHLSRDEVVHAWTQALTHVLKRAGSSAAPSVEWRSAFPWPV